MFITTAQHFHTKIYNHIESLLHISHFFGHLQGTYSKNTTLANYDTDVQLSIATIKPGTEPIITVIFDGKLK